MFYVSDMWMYRDFSERVSERFLENSTKYFEEKRKLLVNKEYEG